MLIEIIEQKKLASYYTIVPSVDKKWRNRFLNAKKN